MPRPPFDVLRWSFLLLAIVILAEVALTGFGALGCFWLVFTRQAEIGACVPASTMVREVFAELLTAVLALILAGRPPSPPSDE
jgi:hypothetical protein